MTEIERRLRAAMHAAVDDEQPPANLLGSVRTRHRRHRTRTAVAGVAIVAAGAVALPPATSALRGPAPSSRRASSPARPPRAAPGTVLNSCGDQIAVNLPVGWRTTSVHVGPLWFVDLRQSTATYYGHSKVAIGGLVVNVLDAATAWVKVVGPAAGHFRFLFGPHDFAAGVGGRYALTAGENGVTFAGCSRGSPWPGESFSYVPGYTQFGGRYLIDKIPRQVSLDVWTAASKPPTRITFLVGY
jgi:hypothetical protein